MNSMYDMKYLFACIGVGWFNTCHLCKEKQDTKLIIQVHVSLIHFVFGSQKVVSAYVYRHS